MKRSIGIGGRKEATRILRKVFLIVCEGAKTEPTYFEGFRLPKNVVDIRGHGANTGTIVAEARRLSELEEYDQVWCVFDRDSFTKHAVNSAIARAEGYGFKVAFSNEAFELWYVLHFCYLDTKLNRHQYCAALSAHLGRKYAKNSADMFLELLPRQTTAIKNAKRLEREIKHPSWADRHPYTGVHLLVEQMAAEAEKNA